MPTRALTSCLFFFFNDTATTEIYTLSLHDALPILHVRHPSPAREQGADVAPCLGPLQPADRKSTRLNSSHLVISYAVFCLKKKKKNNNESSSKISNGHRTLDKCHG